LVTALIIYQRRFLAMHRTYSDGLVKAHEEDRAWIAREVHDDALQRIVLLLHELDDWTRRGAMTENDRSRAAGLRAELEDLAQVLRAMAQRLHPSFANQGVEPALRRLAQELSRTVGLDVELSARWELPPAMTEEQALAIYRIAQEALTNCARHSGARRARVVLDAPKGVVELRVEDMGAGFEVEPAQRSGGLGLISMSERARAAGGSLNIVSRPGGGTLVELRLPVGQSSQ